MPAITDDSTGGAAGASINAGNPDGVEAAAKNVVEVADDESNGGAKADDIRDYFGPAKDEETDTKKWELPTSELQPSGCTKKFRLRSSAYMLTYNRIDPELTQADPEAIFERFSTDPLVVHVSVTLEKATRPHVHVYMQRPTDINCTALFKHDGIKPCIDPNKAKGRAFKPAIMCGHYYAGIEPKIGQLWSSSTLLEAGKFQWLSPKWVMNWVKDGKITAENGLKELERWRCVPRYLVDQLRHLINLDSERRMEDIVDEALKGMLAGHRPLRVVPEVEDWKKQYMVQMGRYKFLILEGGTRLGKSYFAASLSKNPFEMNNDYVWRGFDYLKHDAIIMSDIPCITGHIMRDRERFQCGPKFF